MLKKEEVEKIIMSGYSDDEKTQKLLELHIECCSESYRAGVEDSKSESKEEFEAGELNEKLPLDKPIKGVV